MSFSRIDIDEKRFFAMLYHAQSVRDSRRIIRPSVVTFLAYSPESDYDA